MCDDEIKYKEIIEKHNTYEFKSWPELFLFGDIYVVGFGFAEFFILLRIKVKSKIFANRFFLKFSIRIKTFLTRDEINKLPFPVRYELLATHENAPASFSWDDMDAEEKRMANAMKTLLPCKDTREKILYHVSSKNDTNFVIFYNFFINSLKLHRQHLRR